MANALVRQNESLGDAMEQVAVGGDLSALTATQRVSYYQKVCESVGLNPFTRPFEYLKLNGKLVLYARRDAADQLRTIHGISISKPVIDYQDDLIIVSVEATNRDGRTDADFGVVGYKGLQGEAKANAIMKAITKAKRRVTLSLAGLGWLDETEIDGIPGAQRVDVDTDTGEIIDGDVLFSKDEPPYYVTDWAKLSGAPYDLVDWIRQLHRNNSGPCSKAQYGYVVAIIDELTDDQHNYTLSLLCQAEITKDNVPSKDAASALIKFLAKTIKERNAQGSIEVEVPNPKYRQDMADMVTAMAMQTA